MDEPDPTQALQRLTPRQRDLIGLSLRAIIDGPYIEDWEFHAVMGVPREEAREVLASWPESASHGRTFVTVNNALNNLLGYPHNQWRELSAFIGADQAEVDAALATWRGDRPDEKRR